MAAPTVETTAAQAPKPWWKEILESFAHMADLGPFI